MTLSQLLHLIGKFPIELARNVVCLSVQCVSVQMVITFFFSSFSFFGNLKLSWERKVVLSGEYTTKEKLREQLLSHFIVCNLSFVVTVIYMDE